MIRTHKRALCFGALAVVLVLAVLAGAGVFGRRPFRHLEGDDILSASVTLMPPDVTIPLDRAEIENLAALLEVTVTYRRDDSYTDYAGQGVLFTLELADGTVRTVNAYAPFLIIDGAGYRTKYAPCQALNSYANELLRTQ